MKTYYDLLMLLGMLCASDVVIVTFIALISHKDFKTAQKMFIDVFFTKNTYHPYNDPEFRANMNNCIESRMSDVQFSYLRKLIGEGDYLFSYTVLGGLPAVCVNVISAKDYPDQTERLKLSISDLMSQTFQMQGCNGKIIPNLIHYRGYDYLTFKFAETEDQEKIINRYSQLTSEGIKKRHEELKDADFSE